MIILTHINDENIILFKLKKNSNFFKKESIKLNRESEKKKKGKNKREESSQG